MNEERKTPSNALKPFIKTFMIVESEEGITNRILPDTSVVIGFRYKGDTFSGADQKQILPASVISGLYKSVHSIRYANNSAVLLVVFHEGGAAEFSNTPIHEVFADHNSLEPFFDRQKIKEVEERLGEAKNNKQRIAVVEQFLLSQRNESRTDLIIQHAVQKIKAAKGDIRIKELAQELSISLDPFEKRFRQHIGASPKQFAKIVRLRNVIDGYPQVKNLTERAQTAGYFDQAHFIKDFKTFTGQTPNEFFQPLKSQ